MEETRNFIDKSNHQQTEKSGFFANYINTLNLLIGGGILGLPYVASKLGLVLFAFSIIIVSFISLFACDLLVQSGHKTKLYTYEDLMEYSIQKISRPNNLKIGTRLVGLIVFLSCLTAIINYAYVIKSTGPEIVKFFLRIFIMPYYSEENCWTGDQDHWFLNGNYRV